MVVSFTTDHDQKFYTHFPYPPCLVSKFSQFVCPFLPIFSLIAPYNQIRESNLHFEYTFTFRDNRLVKRECQKDCQHTSCQACYFKTKKESPCPKCSNNDFTCMKEFAKCVKAETCSRQKHPCKKNKKVSIDGQQICIC